MDYLSAFNSFMAQDAFTLALKLLKLSFVDGPPQANQNQQHQNHGQRDE